ncbi:MAG TPA: hypothetical protein VK046_02825 [Actinomycetaceae bacterium]|nr:hypothetical protein [Actinomycetaceae bacterium]
MSSSLVQLAQMEDHAVPLAMPAPLFGIIAFAIFVLMLLVTVGYRNVHTRRRDRRR